MEFSKFLYEDHLKIDINLGKKLLFILLQFLFAIKLNKYKYLKYFTCSTKI